VLRWLERTRVGLAIVLTLAMGAASPAWADSPRKHPKLDNTLNEHAKREGFSRVIVVLKSGWSIDSEAKKLGGKLGRSLGLINGQVVELPNGQLRKLADYPGVELIVDDRPTSGEMNRVAVTVGARAVQQTYGLRGAGVGVAVIDSGVTSWSNDLTYAGTSSLVQTANGQRVAGFVDFVNGRTAPYDDNGHGTHVAGIIAGNGYNSLGVRAGIAPDAHLVSLKVLDAQGHGVISNVIAALDWAVANKAPFNIRVINLSVGAAVTMSYTVDPLALAAKRAVDAGIVVVTAAGNLGKNSVTGAVQYGAITAPANAPWVITVGASSHQGTVDRTDDIMASFSSRGPTAIDYQAKPDLVAPGVGTVSLSDPTSTMYTTMSSYLMSGSLPLGYMPYLSLTGTSMSAPVVAGTVALMVQANPGLSPNLVKAILEYTAQPYPGYNALTEGAGFLNSKGAVDLARYFRYAASGSSYPHPAEWGKTIIWGNFRLHRGAISPKASAFKTGVQWGSSIDLSGKNVVWGTICDDACDNVVWGTNEPVMDDNVVWGTSSSIDPSCDPAAENCDNVVWGTTSDDDNVVWGTTCSELNCKNVVWNTSSDNDDNVVWGTCGDDGDNVVWGTSGKVDVRAWNDGDDNVVWGTSGSDGADAPIFDDPLAPPLSFEEYGFESLLGLDGSDPVEEPVLGSGGIL
jgi:serine protease AprX